MNRKPPPLLGRFDGGVVCFRVYLEQPALALKLTEPALQLLVVHVLKRTEQLLASHRLVLLNPSQQLGLSAPFLFWLFHALTFRAHLSSWNGIFENPTNRLIEI